MNAVLPLLLMSGAGVAVTRLLAPAARPTTTIGVGLGAAYAVTLAVATPILLFSGPDSLAALPYVLGLLLLAASATLARQPRVDHSLQPRRGLWSVLAVLAVALPLTLHANLVHSPGYNPATLFYLTFGSNLVGPHNPYPALWAFGREYVLPFMQLKYALAFPSMLWSAGDPIDFLHAGVPALCVLITVSLVFVAYEFFASHTRPIPAALFTTVWLTGSLDYKLYSVRAETIAWIPAFSFLTALTLALRQRSSRGLWIVCAGLLVTISLLHGIVFIVSVSMAACIWLVALSEAASADRMRLLRSTIASVTLATGALAVVFYGVHARHTHEASGAFLEMEGDPPAAGTVDPGRRFYDLWMNPEVVETTERIREAPPAVSLWENASIALAQPLLSPFPRMSRRSNLSLLALGALAVIFLRLGPHRSRPWPALTLGFLFIIVVLFGLSVALNFSSYGWFPWAVVERRLLSYISASGAMILVSLVMAAAYELVSSQWGRRALGVALLTTACTLAVKGRDRTGLREKARILKPEFAEMLRYLRANADPGDTSVSSWGSMGQMQYLTGLPNFAEGVMPYEIHRMIRPIVRSLERTRAFLDAPHRDYLDETGVRYVLITWRRRPPGTPFSHAPIGAFAKLGTLVLRNDDYAVFDMEKPKVPKGRNQGRGTPAPRARFVIDP